MFDLEKQIREWRQQMMAAGIKQLELLDELEGHLRDDVEQQTGSGLSAQQAFENSVQRIGHAHKLKREFKKPCGATGNAWLWFGSIGLAGTPLLNLAGLFIFHRSSSVFFSPQWWADWFPNYIVWISFIIIGVASGFANGRSQHKSARQ